MQILPTLGIIRRVPMLVWIFLALGFLLVNAPIIAPAGEVQNFQTLLLVYLVLMVAFLGLVPHLPGLHVPFNTAVLWWVGGFVATVFIMTGIQGISGLGLAVPTYAIGAASYLIVMHAIVVASAEEIIFRAALPKLITPVLAAGAFAIFHAAAYALDPMGILIAFIAGIFFWILATRFSIFLAIGCHGGYNISQIMLFGLR